MKNIILFGFMGTGKTVIGKALATQLGMEFVDMDDLIEKREGTAISDVFATKGEAYFRKVESEIARDVAERSGTVVATGGGVVLNYENVKALESTGIGICLNTSAEKIYERVRNETHRPLLMVEDPLGHIREMLRLRKEAYSRVTHQLDCETDSVDALAAKIMDIVREPVD